MGQAPFIWTKNNHTRNLDKDTTFVHAINYAKIKPIKKGVKQ